MSRSRALFLISALAVFGFARALSPRTSAEVVEVTRGDLVLSVEVEGSLRAVDAYPLGPPGVREVWNYKISHGARRRDGPKAHRRFLRRLRAEKRLLTFAP
jgi:hypothetical protein